MSGRNGISLTGSGSDYFAPDDKSNYVTSIGINDNGNEEEEDLIDDDENLNYIKSKKLYQNVSGSRSLIDDSIGKDEITDDELRRQYKEMHGSGIVNTRISDKESDYHSRRFERRLDSSISQERTYEQVMKEQLLLKEEADVRRQIVQKIQNQNNEEDELMKLKSSSSSSSSSSSRNRRSRFADITSDDVLPTNTTNTSTDSGKSASVWDETPLAAVGNTNPSRGRKSRWDETPIITSNSSSSSSSSSMDASLLVTTTRKGGERRSSRWDETPVVANGQNFISLEKTTTTTSGDAFGETPLSMGGVSDGARKRRRWDETPDSLCLNQNRGFTSTNTITNIGGTTPQVHMQMRQLMEIDQRNRPLSDAELDVILPGVDQGYEIIPIPIDYIPSRTGTGANIGETPLSTLHTATPSSSIEENTEGFGINLTTPSRSSYGIPELNNINIAGITDVGEQSYLASIKPEDYQYFSKLLDEGKNKDEDSKPLSPAEVKERTVMLLLLKIKSGTPPQRKVALKQIGDHACSFGAELLFSQILPLLMSPTLEEQERHFLVKAIDKVLYRLGGEIRPFVHKILVVIEPMLIDEDYYARAEGREIISNLAKASGLATMIATMRPDIDNPDEYVRNTTARAFAVVGTALGVQTLMPFLKAVCQSKKSWQARHTGIKIIQQIAQLTGTGVLPLLKVMINIIEKGLVDDQVKVRIITALTLSSLAEAAAPYGIEAFDTALRPLWLGIRNHRGKALAAFLKAIGFIIPLMDTEHADYYTKQIMPVLIRSFEADDEELKRIVLKVVMQCCSTDGVEAEFIRKEVLPPYFKAFWVRRLALDKRSYKQVVETTVSIANNVGCSEIITRLVNDLKDDSEIYRRMVAECIEQIIINLGAVDINHRLQSQLIDGLLYSFQEQKDENNRTLLSSFATVVNSLGARNKEYLPQICGTIKWRLNYKDAFARMYAADLLAKITNVLQICGEESLMAHLGGVLFEYLGEEYPEVLGSILSALSSIVSVTGMNNMTPPIRDLLPRLTPILKNRHEKVQESCIKLIGKIADRGAEFVHSKEWMRICFELLEMLRANKKRIRVCTVNSFGYIAKAIGPQDVLHTLLNNLKVQERTMRVCTTVAISIVAESCGPFTVLPALMNEYRIPDVNIQNGVLKALAFTFEYIGDACQDYIYSVIPLLHEALIDRDEVHRQTACVCVKHLALGCRGHGKEDALIHLLNLVWPNIFEESPHVLNACIEAIEALAISIGPGVVLQYVIQGLYHPARFVREMFWKLYNSLHIKSPEAVVACTPDFEEQQYQRSFLHLCI